MAKKLGFGLMRLPRLDPNDEASIDMEQLKQMDDVAYVRFASVYRQFSDVNTFMEELKDMLDSRSKAASEEARGNPRT